MVRIIDGIPINPVFIIGGWFVSLILLIVLFRLNPGFSNNEFAEYATLGAIVVVVQSVIIPIKFLPVFFSLSGVPLVITIKGVRKGLIISSSAIILNHIILPGAISMLGLNLTNMLLSGLVAGLIPSLIFKRMGRRIRYISGFLGGLIYFLVISILIAIELSLSTVEFPLANFFYLILIAVVLLGLIEGFLTAIGSSYYHRMRSYIDVEITEEELQIHDDDDDELEKIQFFD